MNKEYPTMNKECRMMKMDSRLSCKGRDFLRISKLLVRYFAVLLVVLFAAGCSAENPPGLTVKDGQFFKDGQPYRGVGVNYFSAFIRKLGMEGSSVDLNDDSYRQGFAVLVEHEIPFIRFAAGGFWPNEWRPYLDDPQAYFQAMDRFVKDAEQAGLGLIPSLFWYFPTIPDLVGESVDQWGNPKSRTHAFMRQYTQEVVSRYKDSPAIWAWEFGNEWIHEADLPQPELGRGGIAPDFGTPAERTARDKMYRKNIRAAYQAFAQTVREIDPHRPIFSGDTLPRPAAYHNFHEASWKIDTRAEWEEMFLQDNAAMDALSAHFYYYQLDGGHQDGGVKDLSAEQQVSLLTAIAQRAGKPLWIGEFGQNGKEKTWDEERRQFEFILNLMLENDVPLSALWNFDFEHGDQTHWNITATNHRAYMLDVLQAANRKMKERRGVCEQGRCGVEE